jgi:hypothetical protein
MATAIAKPWPPALRTQLAADDDSAPFGMSPVAGDAARPLAATRRKKRPLTSDLAEVVEVPPGRWEKREGGELGREGTPRAGGSESKAVTARTASTCGAEAGAGPAHPRPPPPQSPGPRREAAHAREPAPTPPPSSLLPSFNPGAHFYPRVLNAHIHPVAASFLTLGNVRVAQRYCHLHPEAAPDAVAAALARPSDHFRWAGADVFVTASSTGRRQCIVVETNSCPSGQKSMPPLGEPEGQGGYRALLARAFMPTLAARAAAGTLPTGRLAVLYDKNQMEASGYAATLADLARECVLLVPCHADDPAPRARFDDAGVLHVRVDGAACAEEADSDGSADAAASVASPLARARSASASAAPITEEIWTPVRAALRYVTQRPWTRIPPVTATLLFNPVLACLAGGRNKMAAAKAYDVHNATTLAGTGLAIKTPDTLWNVPLGEVPLCVDRLGGRAVVKVPYANAGQGVWTLTTVAELEAFMALDHHYDAFIVQALIGNSGWSSRPAAGAQLFHVGTVPNSKGHIHAFDLRVMVGCAPPAPDGSDAGGFFPVAVYARRARRPLPAKLDPAVPSWDVLGTNLSVKNADGSFSTQSERLLMMDSRDFQALGIGLDDLIEAYMQTCLASSAIDALACKLVSRSGAFRYALFRSINPDAALIDELMKPLPKKEKAVDAAAAGALPPTPPPDSDASADVDDEAERRLRACSLIGL